MKLELEEHEITIVLSALFRMPYGEVAKVIDKIDSQLEGGEDTC
jgi:hypothetical protein